MPSLPDRGVPGQGRARDRRFSGEPAASPGRGEAGVADRTEMVAALLAATDPDGRLPPFGPPMSVTSMATARLVTDALHPAPSVSPRLRHVAHIGVRTRDFAFRQQGRVPQETPRRCCGSAEPRVPRTEVPHVAVLPDVTRVDVAPLPRTEPLEEVVLGSLCSASPGRQSTSIGGPTRRARPAPSRGRAAATRAERRPSGAGRAPTRLRSARRRSSAAGPAGGERPD